MQYEVMAPVGSRESLAAALKAGADSIYFGIESLNMRAHSASRFTIKDLHEIAQRCDELGVKSYLTVNTIIYGEDLALMREICDAAKAAHISAVIAADVAVLSYCRTIGQEVHLSTQLNISNEEALRFYSAFADVVVLARELKLEQVKEISDFIEWKAVVHFFCTIHRGRTQWNTKTGWGSGKNGERSIQSPVVIRHRAGEGFACR